MHKSLPHTCRIWLLAALACSASLCLSAAIAKAERPVDFDRDIRSLFSERCFKCHSGAKAAGGLKLIDLESATAELDSGERAIVAGHPDRSELLRRVTSQDPDIRMPPKGEPLSAVEVARLRDWIAAGAIWPEHWAYRALAKPKIPELADTEPRAKTGAEEPNAAQAGSATSSAALRAWCRTPVDRFIASALAEHGLAPSPETDRRILLRRIYFDLTGLPPSAAEVQAFLADVSSDAYEKVVDRLLASPAYGERWARHWIDLVHFAESHGQDQDRPRENAWPYRDYLIRSFNEDKPYARFVQEQVAGDVLFADDPWATVATGLLAAGPWDESSLRDIREDSADREAGRYLDRDDIVTTVMATFTSATVQCARCHDHKFDPISQQDYYSLQAVFAGVDKANRPYDVDPKIAAERHRLNELQASLPRMLKERDATLLTPELTAETAAWEDEVSHSEVQWQVAQVESAQSQAGVPLTLLDDGSLLAGGAAPLTDTYTIVVRTSLPSVAAIKLEVLPHDSLPHSGPGRAENGNLHLSEIHVDLVGGDSGAKNAAPSDGAAAGSDAAPSKRRLNLTRPFADFDQADWTFTKALDGKPETAWGIHPQEGKPHSAVVVFDAPAPTPQGAALRVELQQLHGRNHVIGRLRLSVTDRVPVAAGEQTPLSAEAAAALAAPRDQRTAEQRLQLAAAYLTQKIKRQLTALPPQQLVYCGTSQFAAEGSFRPATAPRKVQVLHRGNLSDPRGEAAPGALGCVAGLGRDLKLAEPADEGQRRAALARWLADSHNGLAWRTIVNRLWYHHFGRGLVETQNDFGRMGAPPSHPELLDYLALELQDRGGSLKSLHRLIVTSAVYRQVTADRADALKVDQTNQWLWRMNRRRLDAESLRDSLLLLSGKLDGRMGGPSDRQFIQTPGVHVTPVVDYFGFNIDDPANYRRSVYRFLFRTLPDPFMESLDCPDASQLAPQRTESVTALQALATLNDRLVIRLCEHLAERIHRESPAEDAAPQLFRRLFGRDPSPDETTAINEYIAKHGLANACRFLINTNEFMFVE